MFVLPANVTVKQVAPLRAGRIPKKGRRQTDPALDVSRQATMEGVQRGNPFGRLHHAQTAVSTRIPHSIKTSFSQPETQLREEAQLERQRESHTERK